MINTDLLADDPWQILDDYYMDAEAVQHGMLGERGPALEALKAQSLRQADYAVMADNIWEKE